MGTFLDADMPTSTCHPPLLRISAITLVGRLEESTPKEQTPTPSGPPVHLHASTLRYRMQRIEALTGRDLSAMADRVDLHLALRFL